MTLSDTTADRLVRIAMMAARDIHNIYHQRHGRGEQRSEWQTCNLGTCGAVRPAVEAASYERFGRYNGYADD